MPEQKIYATFTSHRILFFNFLAFTVCFAVWMLNGVLVTFLVENHLYDWTPVQMGWLIGIPVLTGSVFRLPLGMLTDKYGGKWVYASLLFFCAIPLYFLSKANTYNEFVLCSFGFGMAGNAFSIGIAYSSVWYPKHWQGRALGIFGAGNAGAAITTLLAPTLLKNFTDNGNNLDGWRTLPLVYMLGILVMGLLFIIFTKNKKSVSAEKTFAQMLVPLKQLRVWRFGLYYYLVFGCFVALSQWLVPYYLNMYSVSLITAGLLASIFSLPSGLIRVLGGWISDKAGARTTMYWVLGCSVVCCFLLIPPRMEISAPGKGIMALKSGKVIVVNDNSIIVDDISYPLIPQLKTNYEDVSHSSVIVFPKKDMWHEPQVKVGDMVKKKQLLAKGVSMIYFQANMWIATVLIFIVGIVWGIGKAAVYKFIPDYFPNDVGTVGGMVGVLGGLGGFFSPIIFGYLLEWMGLWTSMWIFLWLISIICLVWLYHTVTKMTSKALPEIKENIETKMYLTKPEEKNVKTMNL